MLYLAWFRFISFRFTIYYNPSHPQLYSQAMNWTSQRLTGCRLPQRWSSSGTWLNVDVRIAIEIPPSSITIAWQQFNINLLKIAWKCLFLSKSCVRTSIIEVIDQILASRTNCFFFWVDICFFEPFRVSAESIKLQVPLTILKHYPVERSWEYTKLLANGRYLYQITNSPDWFINKWGTAGVEWKIIQQVRSYHKRRIETG